VYAPGERPRVEVFVAGGWLPGEVVSTAWAPDGHATHEVAYRPQGEDEGVVGIFASSQVRLLDAR
jgi:hypothetical protein